MSDQLSATKPQTPPAVAVTPDYLRAGNLPGVNVLIEGPTGSGKTTSIATAVDYGYEVFVQMLEPGMESLLGYWVDKGKAIPPNLHWNYIQPTVSDLDAMITAATSVNTLNHADLAKMQDHNRGKYNKYIDLMRNLNGFVDERTGQNFGRVLDWGTDRVLAFDGLTGLSRAAMSMAVGGKPVKSQAEWGIAQDQVEKLLLYLTDSCRCHFILLSHIERETDVVLGGSKITVSTLGKALPPKIPPMFSDVALAVRDGDKFYWDTANTQADLKTRNLPIKANIAPDFGQIFKKWKARNESGGLSANTN